MSNKAYGVDEPRVVWYPATVTKVKVPDREKPAFKMVTVECSLGQVEVENNGELICNIGTHTKQKESPQRNRNLEQRSGKYYAPPVCVYCCFSCWSCN